MSRHKKRHIFTHSTLLFYILPLIVLLGVSFFLTTSLIQSQTNLHQYAASVSCMQGTSGSYNECTNQGSLCSASCGILHTAIVHWTCGADGTRQYTCGSCGGSCGGGSSSAPKVYYFNTCVNGTCQRKSSSTPGTNTCNPVGAVCGSGSSGNSGSPGNKGSNPPPKQPASQPYTNPLKQAFTFYSCQGVGGKIGSTNGAQACVVSTTCNAAGSNCFWEDSTCGGNHCQLNSTPQPKVTYYSCQSIQGITAGLECAPASTCKSAGPNCFANDNTCGGRECQSATAIAANLQTVNIPAVKQKTATISLYTAPVGTNLLASRKVLGVATSTITTTLTYNSTTGNFENQNVNFNVPSGTYQLVLHIDGYLDSEITQNNDAITALSLGPGKNVTTDVVHMIPGDIAPGTKGDNFIDIIDYNQLVGCFGKSPTGSCQTSDLNDDGVIDMNDLNLLMSHFGSLGFSLQTPGFTCQPDPSCNSGQRSLQMCALICTRKQ